jgi:hypothetical protein
MAILKVPIMGIYRKCCVTNLFFTIFVTAMPKVLIYIAQKIMWIFLFYDTDYYENRAHVHVGKKGSQELCKIWLEPNVVVDKPGEFSQAQLKEILELVNENRDYLVKQWTLFRQGNKVRTVKIIK